MSESLEQLSKLIAEQLQRQQAASPQSPPFQLPGAIPGMMPGAVGMVAGPVIGGPMPQPTGVSVAVSVPLPDGREVSLRVHFGPEAAANLQQFAALCAQMFGPYLAAKSPRYAGWNGGYSYGRYGRR